MGEETQLDLESPDDARKYIEWFNKRYPAVPELTCLSLEDNNGNATVIHFDDMTDDEAMVVALCLYHQLDLPMQGKTIQ